MPQSSLPESFPTRRAFLLGAIASLIWLRSAKGDEPIVLGWADLLPDVTERSVAMSLPRGVVQHGDLQSLPAEVNQAPINPRYDGKLVTLPGYVVPLDFSGGDITEFLLVPFVGACIHVPPPPPNQLVLVTTSSPFRLRGLFDAVEVTGTLRVAATTTDLGATGYALAANTVEDYGF